MSTKNMNDFHFVEIFEKNRFGLIIIFIDSKTDETGELSIQFYEYIMEKKSIVLGKPFSGRKTGAG